MCCLNIASPQDHGGSLRASPVNGLRGWVAQSVSFTCSPPMNSACPERLVIRRCATLTISTPLRFAAAIERP